MSQKVRIERVDVMGATPFLGLSDNDDPGSARLYSKDPDQVMTWLCDAWRTRFNQLRSRRKKYGSNKKLQPITDRVDERTHAQARHDCSWMAAVPSLLLNSPEKLEKQDWYAAVKRRKTLRGKHLDPGRMPRFKSRRKSDLTFACWYDDGRNARFVKYNRRHGAVIINGQNPTGYRHEDDTGVRFSIVIRVRLSQPIRDYSSVRVNWTRRELVFVNDPLPIRRSRTAKAVGVDRGCVHNMADSDGHYYDLPKAKLKRIDGEIRRRQKAQARAIRLSEASSWKAYRMKGASKRFRQREQEIRSLYAKAHRIIDDCQQKWTTSLIRDYDLIAIEDLNLRGMGRKPQPKPDPLHPGRYLSNGRAAKRGLNRTMRTAGMGGIGFLLEYKTKLAGSLLLKVDPAYTSQTCYACKYVAKENRESQAVFHCVNCGHEDNADHNAALNILDRAFQPQPSTGRGTARRGSGTLVSPEGTSRGRAVSTKRETTH